MRNGQKYLLIMEEFRGPEISIIQMFCFISRFFLFDKSLKGKGCKEMPMIKNDRKCCTSLCRLFDFQNGTMKIFRQAPLDMQLQYDSFQRFLFSVSRISNQFLSESLRNKYARTGKEHPKLMHHSFRPKKTQSKTIGISKKVNAFNRNFCQVYKTRRCQAEIVALNHSYLFGTPGPGAC